MSNTFQLIKGQLWIHFEGRTFIYEGENSQSAAIQSQSGEILSPMAGKVIKVSKSIGQTVKKGDLILVIEAMKMEYSLKANSVGIVEQIICQQGDQVELGKLLVKIKVEKK